MSKIVIVGAGSVGVTIAYTLLVSGNATKIILIDNNKELSQGQAMDMNHGLPFVHPVHIASGDYPDCVNADVIIITAGARQMPGESRLNLVDRNAQICRATVDGILRYNSSAVLLVITNPVDIMTHFVLKHSGLPSAQVVGSGTVLDSARFRYLISQHCDIDARNVHAHVIGEHGDSEVLLWSQVRLAGAPLEIFCRQCTRGCAPMKREHITEEVKKSAYHIIEAKGATNYGVALAARRIVEAIVRSENSVLTVSTQLNGQYGISGCCLSVPCIVNRKGVERIVETDLDQSETTDLKQSAEILKDVCAKAIA
jgi:L-lactate dehydrogenase